MTIGAPARARSTSASSRLAIATRSSPLPLLTWPEERTATLLEIRRMELRRRIAALKKRSHARIIAEAELRALTHRALQAETRNPETIETA